MVPEWLHILSIAALILGAASSIIIVVDEYSHPQQIWIMDLVWPVTALFGSLVTLWSYFKYGRLATQEMVLPTMRCGEDSPPKKFIPFPVMVGKATSHCGAGCCLGDIIAEWLAFFLPAIAIWFGWKTLFLEKMFAIWVLDYTFAFVLGIAFQYFTIKPMRNLSPEQGLVQAIKADAISLTAWQLGMYGFMALAQFYFFRELLGARLKVNSAEFWFMMQIAMIAGFVTSYPVNWLLIQRGIKEQM